MTPEPGAEGTDPDSPLGAEFARRMLTGALDPGTDRPRAVGEKFAPDGAVLRFAGITTLCHVNPGGAAFAALCEAQEALMAGPHGARFAWLPRPSLHMTVLEGVNDAHRTAERWTRLHPLDAELDVVTADFARRLEGCPVPQAFTVVPVELFAGHSLRVAGATAEDRALLRRARDAMADCLGLRRPGHEDYRFHVTLAYPLCWFDGEAAAEVVALSDRVFAELAAAMPALTLGPVEFCGFETMHRFEPLRLLTR